MCRHQTIIENGFEICILCAECWKALEFDKRGPKMHEQTFEYYAPGSPKAEPTAVLKEYKTGGWKAFFKCPSDYRRITAYERFRLMVQHDISDVLLISVYQKLNKLIANNIQFRGRGNSIESQLICLLRISAIEEQIQFDEQLISEKIGVVPSFNFFNRVVQALS